MATGLPLVLLSKKVGAQGQPWPLNNVQGLWIGGGTLQAVNKPPSIPSFKTFY